MNTKMLCAALRTPVVMPGNTPMVLMVRQLSLRAKDAADMIERLSAAIRDANDLDTDPGVSTDDMLERWRGKHRRALADAANF